jgi:hypothetical protein
MHEDARLRAVAKRVLAADSAVSEWRDLDEIEPLVVGAIVMVEDRNFWLHSGIDWSSVRRAAINNFRYRRKLLGASTIPMQVARMLRGWHKRTYTRKLRESLLALYLVRRYGRVAILEAYLNLIPVMVGTRGAVAGAKSLLGRDAAELTLFEVTQLAVTPSVCPAAVPEPTDRRATWYCSQQMRLIEDLLESDTITARDAAVAMAKVAARWEIWRDADGGFPIDRFLLTRAVVSPWDRRRRRAVGWALSNVGTIASQTDEGRSPRESRVKCWLREFGVTGPVWCGAFVGYGLRVAARISEVDERVLCVPHVLEDARNGRAGWKCIVGAQDAVSGDVALFSGARDRSSEPEHMGFVVANDHSRRCLYTVECNTTPDGCGDRSNGGVYLRQRGYDQVVACTRPRYA